MVRLVGLAIGLLLGWFGAALARHESYLVEPRFIARDGRSGSLKAQNFEIERAYLALTGSPVARTDIAEPATNLALELDRIGFPGGFVRSPLREERIRSSAVRLAQASPVAAAAWCTLALAEAKYEASSRDVVLERLRACHVFAPREIALFETRFYLALALWDQLPKDLRIAAMRDAAAGLKDEVFGGWMMGRLAYGAAVIAPAREAMIAALVVQYGDEHEQKFRSLLETHRKRAHDASRRVFFGR